MNMRNPDRETTFRFRRFSVKNSLAGMKVGTDAVLLSAWALTYPADLLSPGCTAQVPWPESVVDAGTGTGVIALLMAQRFANARITGIELSREASAEASENFAASPWSDRLKLIEGDFTDFVRNAPEGCCDLLISNPPFFVNGAKAEDTARSMARHASDLSPFSLLTAAAKLLRPNGRLCMITTEEITGEIEYRAVLNGLSPEHITSVATAVGKPPRRILWQFVKGRSNVPLLKDSLAIRTSGNVPTPEYRALVEEYYMTVK